MPYNKYKKYLSGHVKKLQTAESRHNLIQKSLKIEMKIQDEQTLEVPQDQHHIIDAIVMNSDSFIYELEVCINIFIYLNILQISILFKD
jgi:hypothetical protein